MTAAERTLNGVGYRVTGSGNKSIVLLRGLARWSDHWLGFDNMLADRGFKVIVIDNRGFGLSVGLPVNNLKISQMAEDVAGVITKEAPGGAHVIGVSLGGMIGICLAAMKPQLLKSLMIINSSVAASKMTRLSRRAIFAIGWVLTRSRKGHGKLADVILGHETSALRKAEFAEKWQKIDFQSKVKVAHLWAQLAAAKKFSGLSEMAAIRCPVMVIKGEKDYFVDPKNSDFIQKSIKNAEIVVHPLAGHEIAFDDPEWMIKKIMEQIAACQ